MTLSIKFPPPPPVYDAPLRAYLEQMHALLLKYLQDLDDAMGVLDHGELEGLADNDHPQYPLSPVALAEGGTGQTTREPALNALLPAQASNSGKVLGTNATTHSWVFPRRVTIHKGETGHYTVLSTDEYVGVNTAGAAGGVTLTLPEASAAGFGHIYFFKDETGEAGTKNITIARAGTDTIDGGVNVIIAGNYGGVILMAIGTGSWITLAADLA